MTFLKSPSAFISIVTKLRIFKKMRKCHKDVRQNVIENVNKEIEINRLRVVPYGSASIIRCFHSVNLSLPVKPISETPCLKINHMAIKIIVLQLL